MPVALFRLAVVVSLMRGLAAPTLLAVALLALAAPALGRRRRPAAGV